MTFIHFRNDFSVDISLSSKALGTTIDPDFIYSITFFTRPNGKRYKCCYNSNTLIKKDGYVTAILNNSGLECGLLKYEVEFELYSQEYPDYHKRIFQTYPSDIELVKSNGETEDIDVQQMFGTTIDDKFNSYDASILGLSTANTEIQANIVSIQELNSVQDASINHIEEMLENFDPSGSDAVQRLDTSVDLITRDVTSLNSSVNSLYTQTEENATGLTGLTNTVNDVSTRVDDVETVLGRKADVSVLGNYYTKDETYNKDEVDRAIADAAMDGSLPAGIVIDNNYVHTDNNYTNADKAKVRDFDLSLYPTNSSLSANYATKAELQNVDDNHPSNSSVSNNYVKKNDMSNYLSDYPTNSSVSENYATKAQVMSCIDENDLTAALADYPTNASVSGNYTTERYVNENYVSWENLDEAVFNLIDNNYDVQWKINEVVNDSSTISDISTNVSDVSVKVIDVSLKVSDISTKLDRDYLSTVDIQKDYITNASVAANYTTKDEFNEIWTTGFLTQDSADELYASKDDISTFVDTNDISTFKSIVFCTQEEYDALVDSSTVDANTVYMLSGDQTGGDYLTPDDVSNFVTTNDISTFITENDASIYVTDASLGQGYWQKSGTNTDSLHY